jgi:two-component system phosphate regulon response regulator OmpR
MNTLGNQIARNSKLDPATVGEVRPVDSKNVDSENLDRDNLEGLADDAPHVLVVDDDQRIRGLLSKYLTNNGFRVTQAADAAAARAALRGLQFDVIILDVMMPGESGLDLARFLKSTTQVPVCMITAQAEPTHRVEGLEIGVDDYVAKPFEPRELLLRLNNIMRRGVPEEDHANDEICLGALTFHITRGELRRENKTIKLTERERELLRMFAKRPGDSISRHELAADESTGSERAIDVQINRLRRKIETDPSNPVYLQTVRGKGYILHTD